jgi:cephalosporin hydroxylase
MMPRLYLIHRPVQCAWRAWKGYSFTKRSWKTAAGKPPDQNPLRNYVLSHNEGSGIWKWDHYFDIYHRHFVKFRDSDVHVMEIGVYSGGSLALWRDYFERRAHIYGVDIEPACKAYECDGVKIFVGDQADRSLWRKIKQDVPRLDVLIDDGGHSANQQITTLEEMLPHLSAGGVYLCEDVDGVFNRFSFYVDGMTHGLNTANLVHDFENSERRISSRSSTFQASIGSIHHYPWVIVIEKRDRELPEFVSAKRGTEWQPFKFGSVSSEHALQEMKTKVRISVWVIICLVMLMLVFVDNNYAQAMEELVEDLVEEVMGLF